jgi:hypothetical protein
MAEQDEVVKNVRATADLGPGHGPTDDKIRDAVGDFVKQFDYWYIRVMREAVTKYRSLIIQRINPFVRRMEFEGFTPEQAATRLVEDYSRRNFVTAGGWAIEAMARAASVNAQKSPAVGIDIQRVDPDTGDVLLYVVKSGPVTRNSDIIAALKRHSRQAEKLLRQEKGKQGQVRANYAIAAGKISSTFEDGIWRPSSGEFWAEILALSEDDAVRLILAIAAEAGRLVGRDASEYVRSLGILVAEYIRDTTDGSLVDWEFIGKRTLTRRDNWRLEDVKRHERALKSLKLSAVAPTLTPFEQAELAEAEGEAPGEVEPTG